MTDNTIYIHGAHQIIDTFEGGVQAAAVAVSSALVEAVLNDGLPEPLAAQILNRIDDIMGDAFVVLKAGRASEGEAA